MSLYNVDMFWTVANQKVVHVKVCLITNLNVSAGLVNSTTSTVLKVIYNNADVQALLHTRHASVHCSAVNFPHFLKFVSIGEVSICKYSLGATLSAEILATNTAFLDYKKNSTYHVASIPPYSYHVPSWQMGNVRCRRISWCLLTLT